MTSICLRVCVLVRGMSFPQKMSLHELPHFSVSSSLYSNSVHSSPLISLPSIYSVFSFRIQWRSEFYSPPPPSIVIPSSPIKSPTSVELIFLRMVQLLLPGRSTDFHLSPFPFDILSIHVLSFFSFLTLS